MNPQTPDNEVALSESVWGAYWPDWESRSKAMKMACEKLEEEVDRLRGLLKDHATFLRKNGFDRQADDLMRHAPEPEETQDGATMSEWYGGYTKIESTEPANPTCHNTTHKFSHCDCREPAPEWRELGADEVIQEGDEVQPKHHSRDYEWIKVWNHEIGATPDDYESMRYRTRRPLPPVVDQSQSKWFKDGAKKQEEMPLEADIASIEWSCAHTARAIRYLRDEIQKLKAILPPANLKQNS